ncbi:Eukaryotic translation initiation factor 2 subunit alpha [Diplonema papillatum]|nr:Eukaryotic translation initiation factor 2 subunit alpha [Diplonema papillatum]
MSGEKRYNEKDIGTCRFYEKKYPDLDDLVMVKVKSIEQAAVDVQLLEYNNIDGMIPMTEVSRRRIRSIGKHLRIGKTEVVQVLRVDPIQGYVDLSKKRVTPDDIRKCEERYNKNKSIHSIMMHVVRQCGSIDTLEELYEKVTWPLSKTYGSAYEVFKAAYVSPEKVFEPLNLEPELQELLVRDISQRLKVQPYRIRADVEVTCFAYEGVDAVKAVLLEGQKMGTEDSPLKITLVAPPSYVLRISSPDKDEGCELMNNAIEKMTELILAKGGALKVCKPPRVVSDEEKKAEEEGGEGEEDEEDEESEEEEESEEDEGEIMAPSEVQKKKKK